MFEDNGHVTYSGVATSVHLLDLLRIILVNKMTVNPEVNPMVQIFFSELAIALQKNKLFHKDLDKDEF